MEFFASFDEFYNMAKKRGVKKTHQAKNLKFAIPKINRFVHALFSLPFNLQFYITKIIDSINFLER